MKKYIVILALVNSVLQQLIKKFFDYVGEEKRNISAIHRRHISSASDNFYYSIFRWYVGQAKLTRHAVKSIREIVKVENTIKLVKYFKQRWKNRPISMISMHSKTCLGKDITVTHQYSLKRRTHSQSIANEWLIYFILYFSLYDNAFLGATPHIYKWCCLRLT